MKISPNAPCPCGTGRKLKKCCRPICSGIPAQSPEALMRSRYTAYALGNAHHIMNTTHPTSPHYQEDADVWSAEISTFCRQTDFLGLQIRSSSTQGERGHVEFAADLRQSGHTSQMVENSLFVQEDGRWLYVRAEES